MNITDLEEELQSLRKQKKQLDEQLSKLQREMDVITQQSQAQGALDVLIRDKHSKNQTYSNEWV